MPAQATARAIATMIAAMAIFTVNDTLMKQVASDLPTMQIIAMRGAAASATMLAVVVALGDARALPRLLDRRVTLRSVVEFTSIYFFITALARFPIADVIAIAQVAPLILVPLAAFVYGDRVTPGMAGLCILGFIGALLITQPGSAGFDPLILATFGTAFAQAARDLLQRRIDPDIPPAIIALSTCLVVALMAMVATVLQGPRWPTTPAALMLGGAGIALAFGHLFIVMAFRMAPMPVVAPFAYAATFWAVLSGWFVFGDNLDLLTLVGIGILVVSGVLLSRAKVRPA